MARPSRARSAIPYDTTRSPGSSSGGSGASVGANLVVCSFCEETGGSCRNPANVNGAAVLMGSQGFYSKFGLSPVSRIRDRIAVICRTVSDIAVVADAIKGYDPLSTESPVDYFNPKPDSFTKLVDKRGLGKKPLKGVRLGIVREHTVPWALADQDRVEKFNQELAVLKELGAELVESVDPEYVARLGDDPSIPNMTTDFNDAIGEILPYYMASYIFKTNNNGSPTFPSLFNYSSDRIKTSVDLFFGDLLIPAAVSAGHLNLRRLQSFPARPARESIRSTSISASAATPSSRTSRVSPTTRTFTATSCSIRTIPSAMIRTTSARSTTTGR